MHTFKTYYCKCCGSPCMVWGGQYCLQLRI